MHFDDDLDIQKSSKNYEESSAISIWNCCPSRANKIFHVLGEVS